MSWCRFSKWYSLIQEERENEMDERDRAEAREYQESISLGYKVWTEEVNLVTEELPNIKFQLLQHSRCRIPLRTFRK